MDPLRVLIVGDDPLVRAGLAAIVAGREELGVTGQVGRDEAAGALASGAHDVVLWAPDEAQGAEPVDGPLRRAAAAGVPVVAVVSRRDQAAAALRADARGVLPRDADGRTVTAALAAVAAGLTALDPRLAGEWLRPPGGGGGDGEPLTAREREVLSLLAEGLGNKAIAARLGVSEHTAKFHVNAILGKLGASSRAEAIVLAARQGLVVL